MEVALLGVLGVPWPLSKGSHGLSGAGVSGGAPRPLLEGVLRFTCSGVEVFLLGVSRGPMAPLEVGI